MGQHWCILRCSGRSTLPLAASLAEDGFDVWTPVETITKRVPRANARYKIEAAMMPSYLFARVTHLVDLLQLASLSVKPRRGAGLMKPAHPDFSVLHAFGGIPLVEDEDLSELRKLSARRTPIKPAAYAWPRNGKVRVTSGIAAGLIGIVVRSTPTKTVVEIDGGRTMEFLTSILEIDAVSAGQAELMKAA